MQYLKSRKAIFIYLPIILAIIAGIVFAAISVTASEDNDATIANNCSVGADGLLDCPEEELTVQTQPNNIPTIGSIQLKADNSMTSGHTYTNLPSQTYFQLNVFTPLPNTTYGLADAGYYIAEPGQLCSTAADSYEMYKSESFDWYKLGMEGVDQVEGGVLHHVKVYYTAETITNTFCIRLIQNDNTSSVFSIAPTTIKAILEANVSSYTPANFGYGLNLDPTGECAVGADGELDCPDPDHSTD